MLDQVGGAVRDSYLVQLRVFDDMTSFLRLKCKSRPLLLVGLERCPQSATTQRLCRPSSA